MWVGDCMENISVADDEDKIFPIRDDEDGDTVLELSYSDGMFHLSGIEGYVVFTNKSCILKSEDCYYITQDDDTITFNEEEYEMIISAMKICGVS